MKYEQPYGVSDPNAAYINGNPTTGTMGSIPPAASIEYPQREIVNLISYAGLTPADSDLAQLTKGVQSGKINYCLDTGTTNAIAIAPSPAITAYLLGHYWRIKVANPNTGPVSVNINGLGASPLVHGTDLSSLLAWELNAGQMIDIAWDGAGHFQLLSVAAAPSLTAPRTVYVNAATGSDAAYDGSQATVSGTHGPFQTIQKALDIMAKYNLGGWSFSIIIADGVYSITSVMRMPLPNGSGLVQLIGNHANPAAVQVYNTNVGSCFYFAAGGNWQIDGLSFRTTSGAPGDTGHCIWLSGGTTVGIYAVAFNGAAGAHIAVENGSSATAAGPVTISGPAGLAHVATYTNSVYRNLQIAPGPTLLNITTPVALVSGFAFATTGSYCAPIYGTITGAGNASGPRYNISANGIIDLAGRGASYLPGDTAGLVATGGQLL